MEGSWKFTAGFEASEDPEDGPTIVDGSRKLPTGFRATEDPEDGPVIVDGSMKLPTGHDRVKGSLGRQRVTILDSDHSGALWRVRLELSLTFVPSWAGSPS